MRIIAAPSCVALFLVWSWAGASPAVAHAFLDRASPRVGSTVSPAPSELTLSFTQNLEPAFSSVEVLDEKGAKVDKGDVHVDPNDGSLLRVSLNPLLPGTYKVVWHVVSVDTHSTEGDFTFQVAP